MFFVHEGGAFFQFRARESSVIEKSRLNMLLLALIMWFFFIGLMIQKKISKKKE